MDQQYRRPSGVERRPLEGAQRGLAEVKLLTARELAGYLRVHPSTIYRLLKNGELPGFKVGSDWRFDVDAIHRWLGEHEVLVPPVSKRHRR